MHCKQKKKGGKVMVKERMGGEGGLGASVGAQGQSGSDHLKMGIEMHRSHTNAPLKNHVSHMFTSVHNTRQTGGRIGWSWDNALAKTRALRTLETRKSVSVSLMHFGPEFLKCFMIVCYLCFIPNSLGGKV